MRPSVRAPRQRASAAFAAAGSRPVDALRGGRHVCIRWRCADPVRRMPRALRRWVHWHAANQWDGGQGPRLRAPGGKHARPVDIGSSRARISSGAGLAAGTAMIVAPHYCGTRHTKGVEHPHSLTSLQRRRVVRRWPVFSTVKAYRNSCPMRLIYSASQLMQRSKKGKTRLAACRAWSRLPMGTYGHGVCYFAHPTPDVMQRLKG